MTLRLEGKNINDKKFEHGAKSPPSESELRAWRSRGGRSRGNEIVQRLISIHGAASSKEGSSPSAWTSEASQGAVGRRHPSPSSLPRRRPRPRAGGRVQNNRATGLEDASGTSPRGEGSDSRDGILPASMQADFRTPVVPFCCICIVMIGDCRGLRANF